LILLYNPDKVTLKGEVLPKQLTPIGPEGKIITHSPGKKGRFSADPFGGLMQRAIFETVQEPKTEFEIVCTHVAGRESF